MGGRRVVRAVNRTKISMKTIGAIALLAMAFGMAAPALARDAYVIDGAGMFNASTVSDLNRRIGDFERQTGKEVVVFTEPSLNGLRSIHQRYIRSTCDRSHPSAA